MKIIHKDNSFVLLDDEGTIAGTLTYSVAGEKIWIVDHTDISAAHKGKGYGGKLVNSVVESAREAGRKIMPLCPFAQKVFATVPEYHDVLYKSGE